MIRLAHFLVALVVLPLSAAACGGDEYQPPPGGPPVIVDKDELRRKQEAREKKEAGKLLQEGDGFWYIRPKTWRDGTRAYQDVIPFLDDAISERVAEGQEIYAEVVFTTILPAGQYQAAFEEQRAEFARHLRQLATDVVGHKVTEIDRKTALHHSGIGSGGAFESRIDQYVVISENKLYTIIFKLDLETSKQRRERLIARILDSWHWTD